MVKNAFVVVVCSLNELRYRGQTVLLDDVFVVVVVVFSIDKITTTTEKSDRGVGVDFL